jgi:hypothetical protein
MDLMTITKREKWHKFYPLALDGSNYLTWSWSLKGEERRKENCDE